MRRRPARNVIWPTRRDLSGYYVTVRRTREDEIELGSADGEVTLWLSRSEARLLARRLNQCLDATVKR